jgi:hypothetical protein
MYYLLAVRVPTATSQNTTGHRHIAMAFSTCAPLDLQFERNEIRDLFYVTETKQEKINYSEDQNLVISSISALNGSDH